jgi:SAM-dependent methyltransferase
MANYNLFAKFYDVLYGDRTDEIEMIRKLISKNNPTAKKVLELACGTGAILKPLSRQYEVSGLDISEGMLSMAKKELPRAKLYHQSMVKFNIPEKFDVILCLFDSVNHLLKFNEWESMFSSVQKHLANGGVFIFDINTQFKLDSISDRSPSVQKFGKNYSVTEVTRGKNGIVNWNIKIFECQKGNIFRLFDEDAKELSFPIRNVKQVLNKLFKKIKVFDLKSGHVSKKSKRLYFVCEK